MRAVTIQKDRAGDIRASLQYSVDTGEKPYYEIGTSGSPRSDHYGETAKHEVTIRDGRPHADQFSLDVHGFRVIADECPSTNFRNADSVRKTYYPDMARLVIESTGAQRVHIFDHTIRHSDSGTREALGLLAPARWVHNDYTHWSAPKRVRDVLPNEADKLLSRRFSIVQVWRPIAKVESDPLAIADARTIFEHDLIAVTRRSPGRIGETWCLAHNPNHCFYYFPQMTPEEALVFKVYDSVKDGRAKFTAHTAFSMPEAPENSKPRESIELRMFAFFD